MIKQKAGWHTGRAFEILLVLDLLSSSAQASSLGVLNFDNEERTITITRKIDTSPRRP
jgi:hypothetical protein